MEIDIQMGQRNADNTEWDNHYPVTKARNVKLSNGLNVESILGLGVGKYGTKEERPSDDLYPGKEFFLTDIKRRIEWNGSIWQFGDGSPVDVINVKDGNIYATSANYSQFTLSTGSSTTAQTGVDLSRDFIMYMDVKLADNDDFFNVIFGSPSTDIKLRIAFGYNWTSGTADGTSVSIRDEIDGSTHRIGGGVLTNATKVIIWYDKKWGYFNIYLDNVLLGSWKPNVSGVNPIADINRVITTSGNASTLITFNYYYMSIPLVTAIGDSITAGAILHAPNPDHYPGVDNYNSSYPHYISDYLQQNGIRNYFVANKGVNGETSNQMLSRFNTDIVVTGCKYTLIHGGINDHAAHSDTAVTIQNKIDMADLATAGGIDPLILGVIPTRLDSPLQSHQFSIDLHVAEQSGYFGYRYVDLWQSIEGSSDIANSALMADSVHPNISGYTAIASKLNKYLHVQ